MSAAPLNGSHAAKYLVLLEAADVTRALLYGGDRKLLGEVIDDGMVVETLTRAGTPCPKPADLELECEATASATEDRQLQCFALG